MRTALVATLALALSAPSAGCNAILGVEPGRLRPDGGSDAGPGHDAAADARPADASGDAPIADARPDAPAVDALGDRVAIDAAWDATDPGSGVGAACTVDDYCRGGVCLGEEQYGMPGGYCSAACTACPTGSHCATVIPVGPAEHCLRDCLSDVDCERAGSGVYSCFDLDGDGITECAALATGSGAVGAPCTTVADCGGGPPHTCIPGSSGWGGGYCTRFCTSSNDCSGVTECASNSSLAYAVCLQACAISADCRPTYQCTQGTCQP